MDSSSAQIHPSHLVEPSEPSQTGAIAAVIITHNRKEKVSQCLDSLLRSSRRPDEIFVVDNASADGTYEHLRHNYPDVHVLSPGKNLFVSAAANLGILASSSQYILVLADDNTVHEQMVEELFNTTRQLGAGISGPKMLFRDDPQRLWSVGAMISLTTGICKHRGAGQIDVGQCDEIFEPDLVDNALFISRAALDKIGLFDDKNFVMQNEEADLCTRARRAGIRVITVPSARLWHDVDSKAETVRVGSRDFGLDSPFRAFLTARNRIVLIRKHGSSTQRLVFQLLFLPAISVVYLLIILLKPNRFPILRAFLRGTWAGVSDRIIGRHK